MTKFDLIQTKNGIPAGRIEPDRWLATGNFSTFNRRPYFPAALEIRSGIK
jgi:hypothetical protein